MTLTEPMGSAREFSDFPRIMTLWPNVCTNKWVSHIAVSLCAGMARHVEVRMHAHAVCDGFRSRLVVPAVPAWSTRAAYRLEKLRPFLHERTLRRYLESVGEGDICWIWPGDVLPAARRLRARGAFVVSEAINCHQRTARRILQEAFARGGWRCAGLPTDDSMAQEDELYRLSDAVFAPSPLVAQSLIDSGVPAEKVLGTSYGWSPERFGPVSPRPKNDVPVTLFVGTVCVRKGAHLLAAAWREAAPPGRLRIAGRIDAPLEAGMLAGEGIDLLGHSDRVPELMRGADVFAFPTLEEGSPLVIYEAAAMGMAIVTTPMGAGEFIRDGKEGIVLDAYDRAGWGKALCDLAGDADLRERLGAAARQRARGYTWDQVALRRLGQLRRHPWLAGRVGEWVQVT